MFEDVDLAMFEGDLLLFEKDFDRGIFEVGLPLFESDENMPLFKDPCSTASGPVPFFLEIV
jgi:hypothetical protein